MNMYCVYNIICKASFTLAYHKHSNKFLSSNIKFKIKILDHEIKSVHILILPIRVALMFFIIDAFA